MADEGDGRLVLNEGRFGRFESIPWWDQSILREARILVVGAGALGNEVIKNLALLGIGNVAIVDMDLIEVSNLCRSILFRESDEGLPKAERAVAAARSIYPAMNAAALVGNVLADVGLGWFRWSQITVGCLDNREARVFVNGACAQVGKPWVDGGIEVLNGVVRGFATPSSACYECTMGQADWDQLNKRRSCSLLGRRAVSQGGTPTTPTTASVIGAIQAQEVVKQLHGLNSLVGRGFVFEGLAHSSYTVEYPRSPECPWHEPAVAVEPVEELGSDVSLRKVWEWAEDRLGGLDAIDFSRELIERLDCPSCGRNRRLFCCVEHISEADACCESCGSDCVPSYVHSVTGDSRLLDLTIGELGLPRWDIVWGRAGEKSMGIELSGDRPVDMALDRSR